MNSKVFSPLFCLTAVISISSLGFGAPLVVGNGTPDKTYLPASSPIVQSWVDHIQTLSDQNKLDDTAALDFFAHTRGAALADGNGSLLEAPSAGFAPSPDNSGCQGICIERVSNWYRNRISWIDYRNVDPGVTTYVWRTVVGAGPEKLLATVKGAASFEDYPLDPGVPYLYRIQTVDSKGRVMFAGSRLFQLPMPPTPASTTSGIANESVCTMSITAASPVSGKSVQIQGNFRENSQTGQFTNLTLASGGANARVGGHYNGNVGHFSFPDAYIALQFDPRTNSFFHAEQLGVTLNIQSSQLNCGPSLQPLNCSQFVGAQYQDILGHGPDANAGQLINTCNSGGEPARDQIVANLYRSAEYQSFANQYTCGAAISSIIHSLLYRNPLASEGDAYYGQCRQGQVSSVVNTIVNSTEYRQKHPGTPVSPVTPDQFSSLPAPQQAEWRQFCQHMFCSGGPEGFYTYSYNRWKQDSYQMLNQALSDLGSAERSNPYQVQAALFIASLFVNQDKHTVQFFNSAILGRPDLRGIAYQTGSVLHLWNYEFALSNNSITAVLNDGKGNGYPLPGTIALPATVAQRMPSLVPPADEGFIQINAVNQRGFPAKGIFIGVFDGNGWRELEDHNSGTFTNANGSTVTGVQFSGSTRSANVTLAVCTTLPSLSCTYPVVSNVSGGNIQAFTVRVTQP